MRRHRTSDRRPGPIVSAQIPTALAEQLRASARRHDHNKGATVCANGLPLPMREADAAVLAEVRKLLQPDIVEGAIADAVQMLRPRADAVDAQREELQARLRAVEEELARLAEAVATGGQLATLVAALKGREAQRAHLRHEIAALEGLRHVSQLDVAGIAPDLRQKLKEWRGLLTRQVPISRQILAKVIESKLVFTPRADGAYLFEGDLALGKLLQGVVLPAGSGLPWAW
jgi:hypothetical protein